MIFVCISTWFLYVIEHLKIQFSNMRKNINSMILILPHLLQILQILLERWMLFHSVLATTAGVCC